MNNFTLKSDLSNVREINKDNILNLLFLVVKKSKKKQKIKQKDIKFLKSITPKLNLTSVEFREGELSAELLKALYESRINYFVFRGNIIKHSKRELLNLLFKTAEMKKQHGNLLEINMYFYFNKDFEDILHNFFSKTLSILRLFHLYKLPKVCFFVGLNLMELSLTNIGQNDFEFNILIKSLNRAKKLKALIFTNIRSDYGLILKKNSRKPKPSVAIINITYLNNKNNKNKQKDLFLMNIPKNIEKLKLSISLEETQINLVKNYFYKIESARLKISFNDTKSKLYEDYSDGYLFNVSGNRFTII